MNARDQIFARVSAAVATLPDKRPLPDYADDIAVSRGASGNRDLLTRFREQMEAARGRVFTDVRALGAWLAAEGATRGVCDPALAATLAATLGPDFTLEPTLDRARIDDYRFGITRAAGAIAETGTLILTDGGTSARLAALAPWIHIAVLDPKHIHAHVNDAIAALGNDPNVIWCTGPSKTADVEGILIEGVHGPGEQVALIIPTAGSSVAHPHPGR